MISTPLAMHAVQQKKERGKREDIHDYPLDETVDRLVKGTASWKQMTTMREVKWSGARSCSEESSTVGAVSQALDQWVAEIIKLLTKSDCYLAT